MTSDRALDGILVVDKPAGPTSHDIVAAARRALGLRKIGHLGTLDPMASGVLPLVVGRATRLASLFTGANKQYEAVIRLGLVTDSYDITGTVVGGSDAEEVESLPPPAAEAVRKAAASFLGSHPQRPPLVSAKKVGGVRAYALARKQVPVELTPVTVTIDTLSLLAVEGKRVHCRLVCSSGFYVRSLAHDLGQRLGCGGCLEALRRERHGPFSLEHAVPFAALMEDGLTAASRILPMHGLVPNLPSIVVTAAGARRASHGNPLSHADIAASEDMPASTLNSRVRVLDAERRLLAIAELRPDRLLHPKIVLV